MCVCVCGRTNRNSARNQIASQTPAAATMMNDPAALGMIPFDTIGLYEQPKPRFIFKMPRVVPDQKSKFESDDLFKKLSRDSEVSTSVLGGFL